MITEEAKFKILSHLTAKGVLYPGVYQVPVDGDLYRVLVSPDGEFQFGPPMPLPTFEATAKIVSEIPNGTFVSVAAMLEWAADRMVEYYGENPNIDFVLAYRREAERLRLYMAGLPLSEIGGRDAA